LENYVDFENSKLLKNYSQLV